MLRGSFELHPLAHPSQTSAPCSTVSFFTHGAHASYNVTICGDTERVEAFKCVPCSPGRHELGSSLTPSYSLPLSHTRTLVCWGASKVEMRRAVGSKLPEAAPDSDQCSSESVGCRCVCFTILARVPVVCARADGCVIRGNRVATRPSVSGPVPRQDGSLESPYADIGPTMTSSLRPGT